MVGVCNLAWPVYANVSCISSTLGRSACRPVSSWNSTHNSHCSQGTAKKLFLSSDLLQVKLHWNPPAQLGEAVGKMMITIFMAPFPLFHHVISPWNVAYFTIKNVFFVKHPPFWGIPGRVPSITRGSSDDAAIPDSLWVHLQPAATFGPWGINEAGTWLWTVHIWHRVWSVL